MFPGAPRLEDGDGARFEVVGDCVEVREQKRRLLLGSPLGASEGREEGREVGIGGDEEPYWICCLVSLVVLGEPECSRINCPAAPRLEERLARLFSRS